MTPLMKQYWDVKSGHPDKIVLFRMGDFFEMFHDDAVRAAPILNIALTSRNKKAQDETPMCGVPHHSIAGPIAKLLNAGLKIAICEQIEDPKFAKGIVKRAVTRVLTPGMVYDLETLAAGTTNYIVCFDQRSLAGLDCSTGESFYYELTGGASTDDLLRLLQPVEVLVLPETPQTDVLRGFHLTTIDHDRAQSYGLFTPHEGFAKVPMILRVLAGYVVAQQGQDTAFILKTPERREFSGRSVLNAVSVKHLEIFETYQGSSEGSLLSTVDRTQTSMGRRRLKAWLQFPLTHRETLEDRFNNISFWVGDSGKLKAVRDRLQGLGDMERRLARLSQPNCNARDLVCLAEALEQGLHVYQMIAPQWQLPQPELEIIESKAKQVLRTLVDEPGLSVREGGIIRQGFSRDLDELIELSQNSQSKLNQFEEKERRESGINSLKVRYNQVFGFYIEITNTHKDKAPAHYQRKQTLANAERYTTDELAELEKLIISAKSKRADVEYQFFMDLRADVLKSSLTFLALAQILAEADVVLGLAWLALENRYCRPQFNESGELKLVRSRHPVVECQMQRNFVPNSLTLNSGDALLLTGPNMAGKSTLMRQVALIAVLAQIGSFVPAESAVLPIYEQILTRIGASDALSEGLSTFMVEMKECAEILSHVSSRSLVILDEIGRGTSTYDGMSLAQAILEYLLQQAQGHVFFATHYHEVTELASRFPNLRNGHMSIAEKNGEISFLHTLTQGAARKSYGIHVAKLAGLPLKVLKRAEQILKEQENQSQTSRQMSLLDDANSAGILGEFEDEALVIEPVAVSGSKAVQGQIAALLELLKATDVNQLRPIEAMQVLEKVVTQVNEIN